jgi:hypothetical protein
MVVREETHIPEQGARINPRNMRAQINSGENWYQFCTHVSMVDEDQPWKRSAVGCCNWMIIYLCWLRTVGTRGWWYKSKRGGVTAPPCCGLISLAPPHCQDAASTLTDPVLGHPGIYSYLLELQHTIMYFITLRHHLTRAIAGLSS